MKEIATIKVLGFDDMEVSAYIFRENVILTVIGTLEGLDSALDTLGATISRGRETVKLTYNNATIKVVVDEKTGKIIDGTWKYDINIDVADADIKMAGINLAAKNLHAVLGFSIEL